MTPSIAEIGHFDVLVAKVRFEDRPKVSKPRPVIALRIDDDRLLVVTVKVTSHAPREWCAWEVSLADWQSKGLALPSVARCSKRVLLAASDIKARCGTLSARDRQAVLSGLAAS